MSSDLTTLIPDEPSLEDEFAPPVADLEHGRPVRDVVAGGPIQFGEAVQFEFEFVDGSREKFHAARHDFPKIVSTLRGYARIAEQGRRASAARPVEVVNPYHATDVRTDTVGPLIVMRFGTTDGIPVLMALEASLGARLASELERELAELRHR